MNDLENFFYNKDHRLIHKWNHYFDVYDRHFSKFRNKDITILEIGVSHGGSLEMWQEYFGVKAKIYGIDVNPECKKLEQFDGQIFIGSQEDRTFLQEVRKTLGRVDILIDDGGHTMLQQITTFEELYDLVSEEGVYLCEDTHTSYWAKFGGGLKKKDTFMEHAKNLIDSIYAWQSESKTFTVSSLTKTLQSLHFYNGVVVLEKAQVTRPEHTLKGTPTLRSFEDRSAIAIAQVKKIGTTILHQLTSKSG